jgi:hypothetical protein
MLNDINNDNICCKPKILIVDDTEYNLQVLNTMIKGYFQIKMDEIHIDEAQNG